MMVGKNLRLKAMIILKFGTQYGFANALGVRDPWISKVINWHEYLPIDTERHWAKMLGCKRTDIF